MLSPDDYKQMPVPRSEVHVPDQGYFGLSSRLVAECSRCNTTRPLRWFYRYAQSPKKFLSLGRTPSRKKSLRSFRKPFRYCVLCRTADLWLWDSCRKCGRTRKYRALRPDCTCCEESVRRTCHPGDYSDTEVQRAQLEQWAWQVARETTCP